MKSRNQILCAQFRRSKSWNEVSRQPESLLQRERTTLFLPARRGTTRLLALDRTEKKKHLSQRLGNKADELCLLHYSSNV